MYSSHRNGGRATFILVIITTVLGGALGTWLVTHSSQPTSLSSQGQRELQLMLLSQEQQRPSPRVD